jgi:hypothetical protein
MATKKPDTAYVDEMLRLNLEAMVKLDVEMTDQEMTFLNVYLRLVDSGHDSPLQLAIDRAKYKFKSDQVKLVVGHRILAKWQGKQDHQVIMRLAGLGPLQIAMKMKSMLEHTKSETAKVQVINIASKCLDMQKTTLDVAQGADIIIKRTKGNGMEEPEFEKEMSCKKGKKVEHPAGSGKVIHLETTPKD